MKILSGVEKTVNFKQLFNFKNYKKKEIKKMANLTSKKLTQIKEKAYKKI